MKTLLVVLLLITSIPSINAQDKTTGPGYALSFGITDNFRLTNFNMDFAGKKIVDDEHQWRLVFSPRISTDNLEDKNNNASAESEIRNYSLGIGLDYLWITPVKYNFRVFSGPGISLIYGKNYSKTMNKNPVEVIIDEENTHFLNTGVRGILGVEWLATGNIGIHSEYILNFYYKWNRLNISFNNNGADAPERTVKSHGVTLSSAVMFGLSVYF